MRFIPLIFALGSFFMMAQTKKVMHTGLQVLLDLVPYLTDEEAFTKDTNDKYIAQRIAKLKDAFTSDKHLIKNDVFAPSYELLEGNLKDSLRAFKHGKKDFAHWRLRQITATCIECHSSIPESSPSSFQQGELVLDEKKFSDPYNLGIGQLIVRRYFDAKTSFRRSIQDRFIKKDMTDILLPMKQLVLIDTKITKNIDDLLAYLFIYQEKEGLPDEVQNKISTWIKRLNIWRYQEILTSGLTDDKAVEKLIQDKLVPMAPEMTFDHGKDIDLLLISGLLANYLYLHPKSKQAPQIGHWIGWAEKYLKMDGYFETGDLYFKQCMLKYPSDPIAKKCLAEYKDSVIFDFTGSSGTHIPPDVQSELEFFEALLDKRSKLNRQKN